MDQYNIQIWRKLYKYYFGGYSSTDNEREFRSATGVHPDVAETIYIRYGTDSSRSTRKRLFMAFYYLKVYPTEDNAFRLFRYGCRGTYRNHLWETFFFLDSVMKEIYLNKRFEGRVADYGLFEGIKLVIDGSDCPIERPNSKEDSQVQIWRRKKFYSGRDKENSRSKYCLKYTVAVQVSTGQICFIDGPRPGSMADITALRESGLLGKIRSQNLDEVILADKGYIDQHVPNILTPLKKPPGRALTAEQDAFNQIISSVRIIVERSIGRIKIFNILNERFRRGCGKEEHHRAVFNICAQITNISLEREPLFFVTHPFL